MGCIVAIFRNGPEAKLLDIACIDKEEDEFIWPGQQDGLHAAKHQQKSFAYCSGAVTNSTQDRTNMRQGLFLLSFHDSSFPFAVTCTIFCTIFCIQNDCTSQPNDSYAGWFGIAEPWHSGSRHNNTWTNSQACACMLQKRTHSAQHKLPSRHTQTVADFVTYLPSVY